MISISHFTYSQELIPNGDFELGPDSSSAGWTDDFDSTCSSISSVPGPDFWTVISGTPDRLVKGDIPCNWDNDTNQSGKAYIVMIIAESGKANLLSPLEKDSTYQLSCSLSLETFRGMGTQPARIAFKFNNGDNPWTSPYITTTQWQHFDTVFKASDNATEIEISGIDTVLSGTKIDNVSLVKLTGNFYWGLFPYKKENKNLS